MTPKLLNSIGSKSQTGLQFWKTWMIMWASIGFGSNIKKNIKTSAKESLSLQVKAA
jgi:hypothetical protein